MDSEEQYVMAWPLFEYHQLISGRFTKDVIVPILIKKLRVVDSEEEAMVIWKKYTQWPFSSRFIFYKTDEKVETLKEEMEILDYFGIDYPPPPDSIKHFFEI
ncbi:MAG TPA: hypothetical protein DDY52_01295 [Candidatus Moranbacteria bacterium]|nr:MAG: hypothetical protein UR51_C0007G0010 [Candidatus Moranbacteria bacterium GW2011_GWF1_34_10]HBD95669.1 hypothetical protein [Spirochaetia bacterium]HBI16780.1 hypothetical protein [Candidatus Moranbacteria bacterium]